MDLEEFMISLENADHFEHHGVKGQKWGVRRNRKSSNGGSIGSHKQSSVGQLVKKGLSNKKVRTALGIAGIGVAAVATYALAGPQIASAVKRGSAVLSSWAQNNSEFSIESVSKRVANTTKNSIKTAFNYTQNGRNKSEKMFNPYGKRYNLDYYIHPGNYDYGKENYTKTGRFIRELARYAKYNPTRNKK